MVSKRLDDRRDMIERRKLLTIAIVGCSLLPMKISGERSETTLTQDVFVLRETL